MRSSPTILILALISGCTYVTSSDLEDRLCELDEDGDGVNACDEAGNVLDCNDKPENGGANETPGAEEIPYDGWDNDCGGPNSDEGTNANGDLLDVDNDGYAGVEADAYEAMTQASDWPGDPADWPADLARSPVDCDDQDPAIYPGAPDTAYDGIDSDCACDNDYDADEDDYVPTKWESDYQAFVAAYPECGIAIQGFGDCDDDDPDVNPSVTVDDWYDGVDHDCAGNNDYDQDADGYMPDEIEGVADVAIAFDAYVTRYGYTHLAPGRYGDCEDADPVNGVAPEDIYPGATDDWYNGVDEDCAADNDFDADGDTWMPTGYESDFSDYVDHWGYDDLGASGFDDCDDRDATIHPEALELLGDAVDQDCDHDGDAEGYDTTSFAFGSYTWTEPRRPVVGTDGYNYLLTTAADEVEEVGGTLKDDRGITLHFPLDAGFGAEPDDDVNWQGASTPYPLGWSAGMTASSGPAFVGVSYYRTSNERTYLSMRELEWSSTSEVYSSSNLAFDLVLTSDTYLDLDLQEDADGDLWMVGCGASTLHVLDAYVDSSSGDLEDRAGGSDDAFAGAAACAFDLDGPDGTPWVVVADDSGSVSSWRVLTSGTTLYFEEVLSDPWSSWQATSINGHDGLLILSEASSGVTVYDTDTDALYEVLSGYTVQDADAVIFDGDGDGTDELYVAGVVSDQDGDGNRDVVLAHGDAGSTLTESLYHLEELGVAAYDARGVGLHVDGDRVLLAASASDALGWAFLGWP